MNERLSLSQSFDVGGQSRRVSVKLRAVSEGSKRPASIDIRNALLRRAAPWVRPRTGPRLTGSELPPGKEALMPHGIKVILGIVVEVPSRKRFRNKRPVTSGRVAGLAFQHRNFPEISKTHPVGFIYPAMIGEPSFNTPRSGRFSCLGHIIQHRHPLSIPPKKREQNQNACQYETTNQVETRPTTRTHTRKQACARASGRRERAQRAIRRAHLWPPPLPRLRPSVGESGGGGGASVADQPEWPEKSDQEGGQRWQYQPTQRGAGSRIWKDR